MRFWLVGLLVLSQLPCSETKKKPAVEDYSYDYQEADMVDPEKTAYGVIICISGALLAIMLFLSIAGRRILLTGIRWHVINCSFWGMVHLAHYSCFSEKAPFGKWITIPEWGIRSIDVECLTRSVFPAGMFFLFVEQMILVCKPSLAYNKVFNLIWFTLFVPFINIVMLFCFFSLYMQYKWFYNPIQLFNLTTYVLMLLMIFVFFIFCLVGSCCCVFVVASKKKGQRTAGTFVQMWMLIPYSVIPAIMYGPSFGMTSVNFVLQVVLKWLTESGILADIMKMMNGGGGNGGNTGGNTGGETGSTGGLPGGLDISKMLDMAMTVLEAMPWFVLTFPIVHAIMTILCFDGYREQFFFILTCGRAYSGSPEDKSDCESNQNWTTGGISPHTVFAPQPVKKEPLAPVMIIDNQPAV